MVFGKDNCLPELFAVVDAQTVHQDMKHLTNGILVKHPLVDSRGSNTFGQFTILVLKRILVFHLIFI